MILGSGTSHGIPVIGCSCPVCTSNDPRDSRYRASALARLSDGTGILIDAGPEFRLQALRANLKGLEALLVTHAHADHIHGLDDVRIFTHERNLPVYASASVTEEIRERFAYIFRETQRGGGKPQINLVAVRPGETFPVGETGIEATAIPLLHGGLEIFGWRIGDAAYLTDCSAIPEASLPLLKGVKNLVIDALRERPHSTHFSFAEALEEVIRISPDRTWLTHISHDFSHAEIVKWVAEWLKRNGHRPEVRRFTDSGKKIEPAHDGLRFNLDLDAR